MIPPLLKLAFVQGPRDGESIEYQPGSTIRIGRYVRGNEIAIKDAGISTKHLRIVSDSENWIIHDLGSSNGTILNSESLDPDTPVILRHGDTIKLGEDTIIVVNFVTDVQAPEHKLPPRPRRNNRRLAVSDPDPDPAPALVKPVQEKPTRKGRPSKQDQVELPKRTRAARSQTLENVADKEKEPEVNSRVIRSRKKESEANSIGNVEVAEEKKGNSRVRRGKNTECVQNSIKLEIEDSPKGVEISGLKRATRSKQFEKVKSEDTDLVERDDKTPSRSTRSKKNEIGGDSFLELEMVLKQARKSRAKKKKMEQNRSQSIVKMEARNDDAGEEAFNCQVEEDKENEAQKGCSERSDEKKDERKGFNGSEKVEQMEIELRKSTIREEDLNSTIVEDVETGEEALNCHLEEDKENEAQKGFSEKSDEKEDEREGFDGSKRVEQVEAELRKSTLGEEDLNLTIVEDVGTEESGIETSGDGCDEEDKDNEAQKGCSERIDEKEDERVGDDGSKRVEQVEIELNKSTLREDGETENLQDPIDEERDCNIEEAGIETSGDDGCDEEKIEQVSSRNKKVESVKVDLEKMALEEWFDLMEVQLPKQIIEETDKLIEPIRSRALRVDKYIAEQKQVMGKGLMS